jgi:hypothetical protein
VEPLRGDKINKKKMAELPGFAFGYAEVCERTQQQKKRRKANA